MRALYVAPNICNNCYNRLFIGFCSDGHHMSMKCCSINMLHGVMKCVRRHRGFHRRFGLFWVVCVRHHKRPHCQFCNLLLQCVVRSYMLLYVFVGHRDSGRCGTAHAQTNGSWWDGSRSFFFMCDAVTMIHVMIKQGPPRLGWPLFFSRKRPLGVSGLETVGLQRPQ